MADYIRDIFRNQEFDEQVVEIDNEGNVFQAGKAPRAFGKKPTILRDPEGEYY
jgi:hypothetical protein